MWRSLRFHPNPSDSLTDDHIDDIVSAALMYARDNARESEDESGRLIRTEDHPEFEGTVANHLYDIADGPDLLLKWLRYEATSFGKWDTGLYNTGTYEFSEEDLKRIQSAIERMAAKHRGHHPRQPERQAHRENRNNRIANHVVGKPVCKKRRRWKMVHVPQ